MTKSEWGEIVKTICSIYPRSNFMEQKETFNAWYELLKDLETPAVRQAVINLAKEKEFPPAVSEIRREYQRMYKIHLDRLKKIRENFELAMGIYPSYNKDDEVFEMFLGKLKKLPQKAWIPTTERFISKIYNYVKDCETNNKKMPDYKEYINEQEF